MAVFEDDAQGALEAIRESGELVTWTKEEMTPNPLPGRPGQTVTVEHFAHMVFFPVKTVMGGLTNGEVPTFTDKGLMGRVDFVPDTLYTVMRKSGQRKSIGRITHLCPNGESILYTVEFTS